MKNIHEMNRTEVIKDLAAYAHPVWYHSLLEWRTPQLKALLTYYREDRRQGSAPFPRWLGRIYRTKGLGDTPNPRPTDGKCAFLIKDCHGNRRIRCYPNNVPFILLKPGETLVAKVWVGR